jgi:outer membrane protein TolC
VYLRDKNVREYFFKLAKKEHPQLRRLKTALKAKKEQIKTAQGEFYQPKLALHGRYEKSLDKSGAGADFPSPTDDEEFQAGLTLSFDLFDSSLKSINLQKSRLGYRDLRYSYRQKKDEIVKNVKTNYYFLRRSYENIGYSKAAREAAKNSLELVQKQYDVQKAAITRLLDAQNAHETARLKHTIAKTRYLQNLVSFYYYCGKIDLLVEKKSKARVEHAIQNIVYKGAP